MQTKIAFFDIDGTLIDMQSKCITEKTLEALQRLRAGGVKICLATGRSPVALPVFPGVEFDAYLTFNGSLCYTAGGETIFSNPIAHEDVQKIIANGAAIGRPVCVSVRDRLAANGTDVDLTDYFAIAKMVVPITEEFDTVCREDVYQLMMGGRKDEYDAILRGVDGAQNCCVVGPRGGHHPGQRRQGYRHREDFGILRLRQGRGSRVRRRQQRY